MGEGRGTEMRWKGVKVGRGRKKNRERMGAALLFIRDVKVSRPAWS